MLKIDSQVSLYRENSNTENENDTKYNNVDSPSKTYIIELICKL